MCFQAILPPEGKLQKTRKTFKQALDSGLDNNRFTKRKTKYAELKLKMSLIG